MLTRFDGWTITDGDGSSDALAGVLTAGSYLIVNNTFSQQQR